jgi:hypothetical protein
VLELLELQRLMLEHRLPDQLEQPLQICIGIVYIVDINNFFLDEHADMAANQLGRAGASRHVAAARGQHRIAAQISQNPELIDTGSFGRVRHHLVGGALLLIEYFVDPFSDFFALM